MKARQASWQSSSWARTFFSRGCLRGSLVQLHRRSFPLDLEIITLLRVLLGGGLEKMKHTEHRIGCDDTGKATTHLICTSEGSWNTPEVVVGELLQRVGFSFILLVRKGYVGQTDGFSPLIRSHGYESLRGRAREGGIEELWDKEYPQMFFLFEVETQYLTLIWEAKYEFYTELQLISFQDC